MVMGILFVKYGNIQSHFYKKNVNFPKKKFFIVCHSEGVSPLPFEGGYLGLEEKIQKSQQGS